MKMFFGGNLDVIHAFFTLPQRMKTPAEIGLALKEIRVLKKVVGSEETFLRNMPFFLRIDMFLLCKMRS